MDAQRKRKNWLIALTASSFLFLGSFAAYADLLTITLDPTSFTVNPGQTQIEVFGTLTNISDDTIFLNGDNITIPEADNISDYFMNTPLWLDAGESSGLISLFSFDVILNATLGAAIGNYTILGGNSYDSEAFGILGSQDFTVTVQNTGTPESPSPVPEPSTSLLFGLGVIILTSITRKRKTC